MFGLFKKKDPICGMKQEKGKGIEKGGEWFCSPDCVKKYEAQQKEQRSSEQHPHSGGCCGGH